MRPRALALHAGPEARARLLGEGLHPGLFDVLVGASGGAKWLVLSALDQQLFPWLLRDRTRPLACVGSSIGAWRHLCLAQADPAAATARLRDAYIDQSYEDGAGTGDVSRVSRAILQEVLGEAGAQQVVAHPLVQTHVLAVRARGLWRSASATGLIAATTGTAFSNLLARRALGPWVERHCFHSGQREAALGFGAFPTRHVGLTADTVPAALMASGSIPLVAEGVRDLMPGEVFWDGGMMDYHIAPDFGDRDGLVLYPHFYAHLAPGWFDKPLRWRHRRPAEWPRLVMLSPTPELVASLPDGRLADWRDMRRFPTAERQRRWRAVAGAAERLAEDFAALCEGRGLAEALAG